MEIIHIIVMIIVLVSGSVGYGMGVYVERLAWNALIEDGQIPKPRSKI